MRSFTLLELIVVLIIVGVLATFAVTHYGVYQERSLDNEAEANLNLIIAAERTFRMEQGNYFISAAEATLNTNLRLFLPTAANRPWDYSTAQSGGANPVCCAQATRLGGPARSWRLCTNGNNRPNSGTCGAAAANCP